MHSKVLLKVLAVLSVGVASSLGFAESGKSVFTPPKKAEGRAETKPSIGLSAGMSDTSDSRRTTVGYNIEYDVQPVIPFSVGVKLGSYSTPSTGSQAALTRTNLLLTGDYNFGGDIMVIKNSYAGLELGPVLDNINNASTVDFGIGPRIGFDIPIGEAPEKFSLGALANYMWIGGAKPGVFALNGVVKYWF